MAAFFHFFSSLPLELRQRIWELGMEPRRVPVGDFPPDTYNWPPTPPPTMAPPPSILQACAESRFHLVQYYVKAFATESPPRYTRINFDIDTVYIRQRTIPQFPAELLRIRHLSIEVEDIDFFFRQLAITEETLPLLEDLEIRPFEQGGEFWTREWDPLMQDYYYNDNPVRFRTIVVNPDPSSGVSELNPDNYLKVDRDLIRSLHKENPGGWDSDFDPWESDDEPDRCEAGWRHAPGCACPPEERWAPRFA